MSLSRADSHSTSDRTIVGSENGVYSPWDGTPDSIIQTPDQWIDLELLNPKFLKGLSQSVKNEPNSKLGKGAARIKAWARQSKAGIDVRLRRRLHDKDEITDIRLVPDVYPPEIPARPEEPCSTQELPAIQSIAELADTATTAVGELDATQIAQPSRSSTSSSVGETLPRYEREAGPSETNPVITMPVSPALLPANEPNAFNDDILHGGSFLRSTESSHRPSVSRSSIVATPARGFSLRDTGIATPAIKEDGKSNTHQQAMSLQTEVTMAKAELEGAHKKLQQERELSESLQAIIQALNQESHHSSTPNQPSSPTAQSSKQPRPRRLKVIDRKTYETDTDQGPSSPPLGSRRKILSTSRRKKSVTFPKQPGKSPAKSRSVDVSSNDGSDQEPDTAGGTLIRKQTLPKRVPATAGPQAIWRSLSRMQTILLGPDHSLTIQAKTARRSIKRSEGDASSANLAAFEQSRIIAERDFGPDHPWVAAFSEDLEKLTTLIKQQSEPRDGETPTSTTSSRPGALLRTAENAKPGLVKRNASNPGLVVTEGPGSQDTSGEPSLHRIDTSVQDQFLDKEPSPVVGGVEIDSRSDMLWNTRTLPHQPSPAPVAFTRLSVAALSRIAWSGIDWLQRNYGPEQPVETGKTRVRWTCSCGESLHDDFIETRPGAARALEAYLNRPKRAGLSPPALQNHTQSHPTIAGGSPATTGSTGRQSFNSSFGAPPSSNTTYSNNSFQNGSWHGGDDSKMHQAWSDISSLPFSPTYEPPWLLTCAPEDRLTPKVTHLDVSARKVSSDKDLANSLRQHYFNVNKKWWKNLRVRGLTTIEFVQFEVHQNRFADIRKVPDVPVKGGRDYNFEPSDLLPPVGSQYLLHLFKHPEDYDGELITYLRAPKRNGRLQLGVGWGINLVEGFLADKVWLWMSAMFALGSVIFGVVYTVKAHDVQGAFGVAAWIITLGALAAGWLQACLG